MRQLTRGLGDHGPIGPVDFVLEDAIFESVGADVEPVTINAFSWTDVEVGWFPG